MLVPVAQVQLIVTICNNGVGLESWIVTWFNRGVPANPLTEKPRPEAVTVDGVIVPVVPGTEK